MTSGVGIQRERVRALHARLEKEAETGGYRLNPDREFAAELVEGLLLNETRYGYRACPCRLASGGRAQDLDIICPCDYRDQDLVDWGTCYCGLYVSDEVVRGDRAATSIPERRSRGGRALGGEARPRRQGAGEETTLPVWRCRVCGYLCAREKPPGLCPICKASQDRFERFL